MNIKQPFTVDEGHLERLTAATVAHRDAQEVAGKAAAHRNQLVLDAIDAGVPQRQVARVAGITTARVHAIVADLASRG